MQRHALPREGGSRPVPSRRGRVGVRAPRLRLDSLQFHLNLRVRGHLGKFAFSGPPFRSGVTPAQAANQPLKQPELIILGERVKSILNLCQNSTIHCHPPIRSSQEGYRIVLATSSPA